MSGPQSVVVPVEPTEAMLEAWDVADCAIAESDRDKCRTIWSAMLAAAPAPSSLAGGEVQTLRTLLDNLVIAQSLSKEIRIHATDEARAYLYDTRLAALYGVARYLHKKRGTEYTLIGVGRAQGELRDDDPVVLYRGDDGGLWARHQVEFCDGRFEELPALPPRHEAPASEGERLTAEQAWADLLEKADRNSPEDSPMLLITWEEMADYMNRAQSDAKHEAPAETVTISRAEYEALKSGYPGDPSLLHEAPADPCASHRSMGFHIDPCCPHCEAPAEGAGVRGLSSEKLRELRDNAARASTDKERGDRWHRSHGCVIALPKTQAGGNYGATVFLPATGTNYVAPYKPDPAREADFTRHAVGADPRTVIQLVDEVLAFRARSSAPEDREGEAVACPKCGMFSGDDWKQCGGSCPMPGSPHYTHPAAPSADKLRIVKPLDWRKPTRRDRDEGGRDAAIWIAPGFGGEYAIQSDLENFILWRIDDPYAFDTFSTVKAAKAHAEVDWQKTITRKLATPDALKGDA